MTQIDGLDGSARQLAELAERFGALALVRAELRSLVIPGRQNLVELVDALRYYEGYPPGTPPEGPSEVLWRGKPYPVTEFRGWTAAAPVAGRSICGQYVSGAELVLFGEQPNERGRAELEALAGPCWGIARSLRLAGTESVEGACDDPMVSWMLLLHEVASRGSAPGLSLLPLLRPHPKALSEALVPGKPSVLEPCVFQASWLAINALLRDADGGHDDPVTRFGPKECAVLQALFGEFKAVGPEAQGCPIGSDLAKKALGTPDDGHFKSIMSKLTMAQLVANRRSSGRGAGYFLTPRGMRVAKGLCDEERPSPRSGPSQD